MTITHVPVLDQHCSRLPQSVGVCNLWLITAAMMLQTLTLATEASIVAPEAATSAAAEPSTPGADNQAVATAADKAAADPAGS